MFEDKEHVPIWKRVEYRGEHYLLNHEQLPLFEKLQESGVESDGMKAVFHNCLVPADSMLLGGPGGSTNG